MTTNTETLASTTATALLRTKKTPPPAKREWMKHVGWAKDDPTYDEAMRLGAEWRAEVNRKSIEELDKLDGRS